MKEAEPPDTTVDTNHPINSTASTLRDVLEPHNPPPRVHFSIPHTQTKPPPIPQPIRKHHALSAKVNTPATTKQSLQNKIGTLADDKLLGKWPPSAFDICNFIPVPQEAPPNNYGTYPTINNRSNKTSQHQTT